jgi:hypothetical protein
LFPIRTDADSPAIPYCFAISSSPTTPVCERATHRVSQAWPRRSAAPASLPSAAAAPPQSPACASTAAARPTFRTPRPNPPRPRPSPSAHGCLPPQLLQQLSLPERRSQAAASLPSSSPVTTVAGYQRWGKEACAHSPSRRITVTSFFRSCSRRAFSSCACRQPHTQHLDERL